MSLRLNNIKWNLELPDGSIKEIIKDISLEFGDGRLVVVTGPNGGGKTTLAKLISGVVAPTEGNITLEKSGVQTDITNMNVTDRAKSGIAYAFQQPVRFKGLTIKDFVKQAYFYKDTVKVSMEALRTPIDKLEMIVSKDMWPMPSYGDLMFEV